MSVGRLTQPALLVGRVDERSLHQLLSEPASGAVASVNYRKSPADKGYADDDRKRKNRRGEVRSSRGKKGDQDQVKISVYDVDDQKYEHLEGVIKELLKQHKEDATVLKESISQCDLKCDAVKDQYNKMVHGVHAETSTGELKDLLASTLRENLELRQELLRKDAKFLQLQVDQINSNLRRRPSRHGHDGGDMNSLLEEAAAVEKDLKVRLAKTEIELIEKTNVSREAATRMAVLEEKCEYLERENEFLKDTHQSCVKTLKAKNELLEKRCEKSDTRRKLESAGLSQEIRECKWLLKNLSRNVGKCARLYSEAKMELIKGRVANRKTKDDTLSVVLDEESSNRDRLTNWFLNTHPKVAQKAMSVWTDYLERHVIDLEQRVGQTRKLENVDGLEVLYTHKSNKGREKEIGFEEGGRERSAKKSHRKKKRANKYEQDDKEEDDDLAECRKIGKCKSGAGGIRAVAPSPTWFRICEKAGLSLDNYFTPQINANG